MNAKLLSLAILVPMSSQAAMLKTVPTTTRPLTMPLAPITNPVSSPVKNLMPDLPSLPGAYLPVSAIPDLPSVPDAHLPASAIPAAPMAGLPAKTDSAQPQANPMTVLTNMAAASEATAPTEVGRTYDGAAADQEDDNTPAFVSQARDSLKNQARAELKIQIREMNKLAEEFRHDPKLGGFLGTDYPGLFLEQAEKAAANLKTIGAQSYSSEGSDYTRALIGANASVRTVENLFSTREIRLLSSQDTVRLADFFALSHQSTIELLLEEYKLEVERVKPDYPPLRMKDLEIIQRKLKSGEMNEYGLRASLAFIQQNNGGRIFFPLMDRIKNEWQLMAFRSLIANLHSHSTYADSYTQKSHARSIIYASTPKRLAIFRNVLEEDRYILRKGPLLKQVSRHIQNNPSAEDALKQLTAMSELLSNLDMQLDDPRLIKLLARIDNAHQVKALKQIAQRKSTILPNERHTTTTYRKKELTFGEEVQDFLVGIDKRGTWDFETEYQPSPIIQRALTKLLFEVGDIRTAQDAKNHAARLADYLKFIKSGAS